MNILRKRQAHGGDDQVHVGHDGWLFLVAGSNAVIDLYRDDSSFTDELARDWVELLRARKDRLNARGIDYVHLAAPEKLTLLHRFYDERGAGKPIENPAGSPIQQLVDRYDWDTPALLNVLPYLSSQIDNYPIYWKSDTHWSAWGCFLAYQLLCSRLGIPTNDQILNYPFVEGSLVMDLGGKLDPPLEETARFYRLDRYSRRVYANPLVRYKERLGLADDGHLHVGSHVIFRNDSPDAADKVVVLFGDSFSEYRNHLLSGMLAETVRELHFVWNASIDDEYVRRVRPDIVVTELAERFMTRVPVDDLDIVKLGHERVAAHRAMNVPPRPKPTSRINRSTLLEATTRPLPPPVTVQPGCTHERADETMTNRPIELVEAFDARVYFTGERCLVTAPGGEEIVRYGVDEARAERIADEEYRRLPGTTLLLADSPGAYSYYHWMIDILPKLGLLGRGGVELDTIDRMLVREADKPFHVQTLERLGIDASRIVETVRDSYLACDRLLHVGMGNDSGMRTSPLLPEWLRERFAVPPADEPRLRLYVSRPEGVRRGIRNEAQMRPLLEAAGFTMIAMEGLSVEEQARLFERADVVMSPHGAALTNIVFCRPGTRVVELFSRHVYPFYYGLASACEHVYHAILENPAEDYPRLVSLEHGRAFTAADIQWSTQHDPFDVPLEALEAMLATL